MSAVALVPQRGTCLTLCVIWAAGSLLAALVRACRGRDWLRRRVVGHPVAVTLAAAALVLGRALFVF